MARIHKALVAATFTAVALGAQAAPTDHSLTVTFANPIDGGLGGVVVNLAGPGREGGIDAYAERFTGTASNLQGITAEQLVGSASEMWMYCYDIAQTVGSGLSVDYTVDYGGAVDRTLAFLGAVNSVLGPGDPFAWLKPGNKETAAAIQLGIWESLYEASGWDIDDGVFKAAWTNGSNLDGEVRGHLEEFFDALETVDPLAIRYTMVLRSDKHQDVITGDPIPIPGTLALLLAPAGLLAIGRRNRRNRTNDQA